MMPRVAHFPERNIALRPAELARLSNLQQLQSLVVPVQVSQSAVSTIAWDNQGQHANVPMRRVITSIAPLGMLSRITNLELGLSTATWWAAADRSLLGNSLIWHVLQLLICRVWHAGLRITRWPFRKACLTCQP